MGIVLFQIPDLKSQFPLDSLTPDSWDTNVIHNSYNNELVSVFDVGVKD